ncbi:MAG: hypothetical protein Q4G26_06550 [Paracoccus sp. (in: a-proteobacteria)]|nr:hypothetical protein [Paracoccus sp. (in: a-proteobacteria)]
MSLPEGRPIFLERAAYRRRRLQDAARLLPVATLIALLLPVWIMPEALSGAAGVVAVFLLWFVVIVVSALIHRRLGRPPGPEGPPDEL